MVPTFSIIVPTCGRSTLARALASLSSQPLGLQDEVLVIGPAAAAAVTHAHGYTFIECQPGLNWGNSERQIGIQRARGTHLAFLDDDDAYLPGALATMRRTAAQHPSCPILFKTYNARRKRTIWRSRILSPGNQGIPQFVTPNRADRLGAWTDQRAGDYDFIVSTVARYPANALVWDGHVTYYVPRGER